LRERGALLAWLAGLKEVHVDRGTGIIDEPTRGMHLSFSSLVSSKSLAGWGMVSIVGRECGWCPRWVLGRWGWVGVSVLLTR
jgi:hypothetical protein